MPSEALVVGCGQQKIWKSKPWLDAVPAKDAYTGPLFRLCRQYAELYYRDRWFIFSALYGIIMPGQEIRNYDVSFKNPFSVVISHATLTNQCAALLAAYQVIVSLAGKLTMTALAVFYQPLKCYSFR